jgi:hypothetical protein
MEMKILLDYTNKRQFGRERKMCENEVKWEDKKKLLFAFYVLFSILLFHFSVHLGCVFEGYTATSWNQ